MAVRYHGDVEIRMSYRDGRYVGRVRAPGYRGRGSLTRTEAGVFFMKDPRSPEAYDRAARAFLERAKRKGARLPLGDKLLRVFQSPCPRVS